MINGSPLYWSIERGVNYELLNLGLLSILNIVTPIAGGCCHAGGLTLCARGSLHGPGAKSILLPSGSGLGGMLGFGVAVIAGIAYLITRQRKWDIAGYAAVEVSLVFFFIAIVAGSIWARRTWGTWWTWDPRLTSAAIVELVYAAYLMLRQGIEDPDRRARFGAVYAIVAFISVPITFFRSAFAHHSPRT